MADRRGADGESTCAWLRRTRASRQRRTGYDVEHIRTGCIGWMGRQGTLVPNVDGGRWGSRAKVSGSRRVIRVA